MPVTGTGAHAAHWIEAGTGDTPALLLHCALGHARAWEGLMARLGDVLRMRAMDLPGHGTSAPRLPQVTAQQQGAVMAAALAREMGPPVVVVGHSLGGTIALRLALEHPDLVSALVLVEPVQFSILGGMHDPSLTEHLATEAELAAMVAAGTPERAAAGFLARWGDGRAFDTLPEAQRAYIGARMHMIHDHSEAMRTARVGPVTPEGLARLAVPVLLVEGAGTQPVIAAVHDRLEQLIPGAGRLRVSGAGHMVPISHPEQVAGAIREFLGFAAGPAPAGRGRELQAENGAA